MDDGQGRVWLGLDGDLWRYEPISAEWAQFVSPTSPLGGSSFFNWVPVIVVDQANDPWAELLVCGGGGCGGEMLYHLHDGTWTLIMEMNSHYFRKLVFDGLGAIELIPGTYLITYNEIVHLPKNIMALGRPRSSLLRCGVTIGTAVWDAGYEGRSQSLLVVYNSRGVRLEKNARIMQLVFLELTGSSEGYNGIYQGENI